MGAIPSSNMPGHKQLHERVINALDRCQETQRIDFKESASWDVLKLQIVRTLMAMGNLRDGGTLIIGVSERNNNWSLTGITVDDLNTYNVDDVIDFVNTYCSPPISIDMVLVEYRNGNQFLVLHANQFEVTPFVCRKNGPQKLVEGAIYVRPPGIARTTRVTNATQIHDLLELAAEKRARRILEVSRRIGLVPSKTSGDLFDEELGGL